MMRDLDEPWLKKSELARKLRIHPRTVERLHLPIHERVGGQNRYLLSEVKAELAARSRGSEPPHPGGDNVIELRPRQERKAA